MNKYMTIEKLLDDALNTSSAEYHTIVNAFDGVEVAPVWERLWCHVVCKYIEDYNDAAHNWNVIPADLSTPRRQAMIEKTVLSIIHDSICTTKTGVKYYRLDDCPMDEDDLKEMPEIEKIYSLIHS